MQFDRRATGGTAVRRGGQDAADSALVKAEAALEAARLVGRDRSCNDSDLAATHHGCVLKRRTAALIPPCAVLGVSLPAVQCSGRCGR